MENPNELWDPGTRQLRFRNMQKCDVLRLEDGEYVLDCTLHNRGTRDYRYRPGENVIRRGTHVNILLEDAQAVVNAAVAAFNATFARMQNNPDCRFDLSPLPVTLYAEDAGDHTVNALLECRRTENGDGADAAVSYEFRGHTPISALSRVFCGLHHLDAEENKALDRFLSPDRDNWRQTLPYLYAQRTHDEYLLGSLELKYGDPAPELLTKLTQIDGIRRLPRLSEAYNQNYIIEAESLTQENYRILEKSGYTMLHRSNVCMMGHTRRAYQINPHAKCIVDAAPVRAEAMPFAAFLTLFEEKSKT